MLEIKTNFFLTATFAYVFDIAITLLHFYVHDTSNTFATGARSARHKRRAYCTRAWSFRECDDLTINNTGFRDSTKRNAVKKEHNAEWAPYNDNDERRGLLFLLRPTPFARASLVVLLSSSHCIKRLARCYEDDVDTDVNLERVGWDIKTYRSSLINFGADSHIEDLKGKRFVFTISMIC